MHWVNFLQVRLILFDPAYDYDFPPHCVCHLSTVKCENISNTFNPSAKSVVSMQVFWTYFELRFYKCNSFIWTQIDLIRTQAYTWHTCKNINTPPPSHENRRNESTTIDAMFDRGIRKTTKWCHFLRKLLSVLLVVNLTISQQFMFLLDFPESGRLKKSFQGWIGRYAHLVSQKSFQGWIFNTDRLE